VRTANLASAIFRSVWNPVRSETSATSRSRPTSVVGCIGRLLGWLSSVLGRELGGQARGNKVGGARYAREEERDCPCWRPAICCASSYSWAHHSTGKRTQPPHPRFGPARATEGRSYP